MRLDPIGPDSRTDEQRALHEDVFPAVHEHLRGFVSQRADGALLGPFPPMLAWPAWGGPACGQTTSVMTHTVLPKPAHEVAILVVGSALQARFEVCAHQHVGESSGLSTAKVAAIGSGQRPADLDVQQAAAHDRSAASTRGGPVPRTTWQAAVDAVGDEGSAELVYLVGTYCLVSVLLNGFDMTVPGSDPGASGVGGSSPTCPPGRPLPERVDGQPGATCCGSGTDDSRTWWEGPSSPASAAARTVAATICALVRSSG